MPALDPADLLFAAGAELARRGDPRFAPLLQRAEQLLAGVEPTPDGLPPGKALEHVLGKAGAPARQALRDLLVALGASGVE